MTKAFLKQTGHSPATQRQQPIFRPSGSPGEAERPPAFFPPAPSPTVQTSALAEPVIQREPDKEGVKKEEEKKPLTEGLKTVGGQPVEAAGPATEAPPKKSYWFQEHPPEKMTTPEGLEFEKKGQAVIDPRTYTVETDDPSLGPFTIQFAGLDTDFRGDKPTEEMARAEQLILQTIRNTLKNLLNLPDNPINYEYGGNVTKQQAKKEAEKKAQAELINAKTVRARLKEAFRELSKHPLNIFIATDLTVAEKMSPHIPSPSTEQIYVRPDEYGDPAKLQGAIRIPLVNLLGGEAGLKPGGEHGFESKTVEPLTDEQRNEALLHETMHVLLIDRGASAGQVWESVRPTMVKGTGKAKELCEDLMWRYIRAQEEVFVYTHVGEIYSEFSANKPQYEKFIEIVGIFLASLPAGADQTKIFKLDVSEKVAKKKVDWAISFHYPKSVNVNESHIDQIKVLKEIDIGN